MENEFNNPVLHRYIKEQLHRKHSSEIEPEIATIILDKPDPKAEAELAEKLLELNQAIVAKVAELGLEFGCGDALGGRFQNPPWDGPLIFSTNDNDVVSGKFSFSVTIKPWMCEP